MTQRFWKRPEYLGNAVDKWDTALLCWKWVKNLTIGLNMREMTYILGK